MNRHIKKVAVLGSGVMGSRIACHFANIGCEVILLDIAPKEISEQFPRAFILPESNSRIEIKLHRLWKNF